ncbi:MAG: signal recognition particle protein [Anaerolineaceae bacterium]|nr:signal recognition particle protein [Anaerolineaceae bacterium]
MFENLSGQLDEVFSKLRRRGRLSEQDVDAAMREIRLALLEADVHYSVVKDFISRVRERAIGQSVSKALNPAQQIFKIVHEELVSTLGTPAQLNLSGNKPRVIILVGLQGSGKTTATAKIAKKLRAQGERVMMVAADPYRPAAITQLQTLGSQIGVPVFTEDGKLPPEVVRHAYDLAKKDGTTVMMIDTAGRSQLDQQLMNELDQINQIVHANEVLLVVDAMIGQEALPIAEGFRDAIPLTGLILSKMDGDARGGASISIRGVTGVSIKYLGTGEGIDGIELYDPSRLASRILGMGDVMGLIERAEATIDQDAAMEQAERMLRGEFSLEDFANQLRQVRKMGPFNKILEMMPGQLNQAVQGIDSRAAEKELIRTEAIINSMTKKERQNPSLLNANRRRRIASGSGTTVQDVNRVMKQFRDAQKLFKKIKKTGGRGLPNDLFR